MSRTPLLARPSWILAVGLCLGILALSPRAAGAQQTCYALADAGGGNGGNDLLTQVDRATATETPIGTGLGTSYVEAIAYSPFLDKLYGADADQFGEINTSTGVFTPIGSGFGTGDGPLGSIGLTDVDGLHFDPYPGELHGVHRRGGSNENDLLFQVDRSTGGFIPGAFPDADGDGNADDYLEIKSGAVGVWDIDDLAIDPSTGVMYATGNNGGSSNVLLEINRITGDAALVGSVGYDDIEGLSFDTDGQLFGSAGSAGGSFSNYLFDINKSTGAGTPVGPLTAGSDYEGIACLTSGMNQISGRVYLDADEDAVRDPGETGAAGITVRLFRDDDGNGERDIGEPQAGTRQTDGSGDYLFEVAATGDFVVLIFEGDLPSGSSLTTDDIETVHFDAGSYGSLDAGNDFGYATPSPDGDLTITKTSNGSDTLPPGFTLSYAITVENSSGITQTGIAVRDTLPPNIAYVAGSTQVTRPGAGTATFRDEFNAQAYSGNDGTANWPGAWSEVGDDGSPTGGNVQVQQDNAPFGVIIAGQNKGLERSADLSVYTSAAFTFRYRAVGANNGDKLRVYANGNQVTEVRGSQSSYTTVGPLSLDAYTGGATTLRFETEKLRGGASFWIDDVELAASNINGTTTAGNAPPLLASDLTLDPGEQVTITYQATVNSDPETCQIENTAWVESDQTTLQGDTRVDLIDASTACHLPVELIAFGALTDGHDVLLSWDTASETNNAGFEIQIRNLTRAQSATDDSKSKIRNWEALGWVDGAGTTLEMQRYSYRIADLAPGRYAFRLKQIDYDGTFEVSPEVEVFIEMPGRIIVEPVYPNPFNPEATLRFAVRQPEHVEVTLFDVLGRQMALLYAGEPAAGSMQAVRIDGSALPSGLYMVRIAGEHFTETQTVTLLK